MASHVCTREVARAAHTSPRRGGVGNAGARKARDARQRRADGAHHTARRAGGMRGMPARFAQILARPCGPRLDWPKANLCEARIAELGWPKANLCGDSRSWRPKADGAVPPPLTGGGLFGERGLDLASAKRREARA